MPIRHKKLIWQALARREAEELGDLREIEPVPGVRIDMERLARDSIRRAAQYKLAREEHIAVDPTILGGTPVIRGTRLTVYAVRGRLAEGERVEDILEDYPRLAREAVEAANVYAQTHPLRGRPAGRPWRAAAVA